ncbi:uncharacterized protein C2orf81 homolog isoform X2 [Solea solea]|uniref:uncharacterized protein C2orf81 homolog isoform X2 n=1 Tax=Solea solea TaxID=90069 RepID=UPI00272D12E5|nr:uncharacterized protein C2orf81 homolog isoform X2 [Solea solea]
MPRSVVKSQASKEITTPSGPGTPPPVQDPEYIVPGRLTKAQWTKALRQEHTDDIVGEIVDDLLNKVMEGCLKAHVKGQMKVKNQRKHLNLKTQSLSQLLVIPGLKEVSLLSPPLAKLTSWFHNRMKVFRSQHKQKQQATSNVMARAKQTFLQSDLIRKPALRSLAATNIVMV